MPRRNEVEKHPALLVGKLREMNALVQEMDEEELRLLRGWDSFTPEERKFLAMLAWHRTAAETNRILGRRMNWHNTRYAKNPLFREAVTVRQWTSVRIARFYAIDALALAAQTHALMVHPDNPLKISSATQLGAIVELYKLTGLTRGAGPAQVPWGGNTFINTQNVAMFGRDKSISLPAAEVVEEDEGGVEANGGG